MPSSITLIIGKNSNLSKALSKRCPMCVLISAKDILENVEILFPYLNHDLKIIFNNFVPATELNQISSSVEYIQKAILATSMVLDTFKDARIKKIIYTSSSSVYGNNILCKETDELKPMNLHASLKVANEKLIEKFCFDREIDYTIARLFNMYGGEDRFSVISKIINSIREKKVLTIVNHGNAIRDFIHVDDVASIYLKLLSHKNIRIINIGSGFGTSIKNILDYLSLRNKKITINNISKDELKISTADTNLLQNIVDIESLIKIEEYIEKSLNI